MKDMKINETAADQTGRRQFAEKENGGLPAKSNMINVDPGNIAGSGFCQNRMLRPEDMARIKRYSSDFDKYRALKELSRRRQFF